MPSALTPDPRTVLVLSILAPTDFSSLINMCFNNPFHACALADVHARKLCDFGLEL